MATLTSWLTLGLVLVAATIAYVGIGAILKFTSSKRRLAKKDREYVLIWNGCLLLAFAGLLFLRFKEYELVLTPEAAFTVGSIALAIATFVAASEHYISSKRTILLLSSLSTIQFFTAGLLGIFSKTFGTPEVANALVILDNAFVSVAAVNLLFSAATLLGPLFKEK